MRKRIPLSVRNVVRVFLLHAIAVAILAPAIAEAADDQLLSLASTKQNTQVSLVLNPSTGEVGMVWLQREYENSQYVRHTIQFALSGPASNGLYSVKKTLNVGSKLSALYADFKVYPSITWHEDLKKYLVLFSADRADSIAIDLIGVFIKANGSPAGKPFTIVANIDHHYYGIAHPIRQAASPAATAAHFLLVWERYGSQSGIYSQFLDAKAKLIGDATQVLGREAGWNYVYQYQYPQEIEALPQGGYLLAAIKSFDVDSEIKERALLIKLDGNGAPSRQALISDNPANTASLAVLGLKNCIAASTVTNPLEMAKSANRTFSIGKLKAKGSPVSPLPPTGVTRAIFVKLPNNQAYEIVYSYPQFYGRFIDSAGIPAAKASVLFELLTQNDLIDAVLLPGTNRIFLVYGHFSPNNVIALKARIFDIE